MMATQAGIELESFEFQQDSETYRAEYDQETTSASMAVVASLSEAMDSEPTELEPLYASVDTGALDDLVRVSGTGNGNISVTFTVEKYAITVSSYGVVTIAPPGSG